MEDLTPKRKYETYKIYSDAEIPQLAAKRAPISRHVWPPQRFLEIPTSTRRKKFEIGIS
jgi:hypothetical protein